MATTTVEEVGRQGQMVRDGNRTMQRKYRVKNAATEADAWNAIYAKLVTDFGVDPPDTTDVSFWDINVVEDLKKQWNGTVNWKRYQHQVGESQFNFEVSVESQRIILPVSPITTYAASGQPALSLHLLGDRCDGREAEGIDLSIPVHTESTTRWVAGGDISGLKAVAKSLVGKTNNATWNGNAAGECLLTGVSGSRRGIGDWELTFRWAVRENQSGLTIGSITGISKGGWQYLWPISRLTGTVPQRQVTHVAVATVYQSGDFSAMGI